MRAALLVLAATLGTLLSACMAPERPVSPHPKLVATLSSMSAWQVTFIDPARFAEAPVQQADAERMATRGMTMSGTVVSWAVQVEGRDALGRSVGPPIRLGGYARRRAGPGLSGRLRGRSIHRRRH